MKNNEKFNSDILTWWQTKAIKQYSKLYDEDRLDDTSLWYNNLDDNKIKSWFSARGKKQKDITKALIKNYDSAKKSKGNNIKHFNYNEKEGNRNMYDLFSSATVE